MTAPTTPTWDEFAAALRKELGRMGDGILFVISHREQPWHYAQFAQYLDETFAEVSGETVQDPAVEEAPTPEGTRILESLGWAPPMRREGYRWHRFVPYPPTSAEYREIVDAVVAALRDVNGVPSPDHLTYRAWNGKDDNKPWPVELPGVRAEGGS
ncbi:TY-Chap domain-containing protein [Dactylosporangium sp. CA-139114]|uniref:TY-Chap domain-containing protein n=1 Tax=Dactylosporangium sp. CA-139114 TaxID=3239931 RepID=UPI003D99E768